MAESGGRMAEIRKIGRRMDRRAVKQAQDQAALIGHYRAGEQEGLRVADMAAARGVTWSTVKSLIDGSKKSS